MAKKKIFFSLSSSFPPNLSATQSLLPKRGGDVIKEKRLNQKASWAHHCPGISPWNTFSEQGSVYIISRSSWQYLFSIFHEAIWWYLLLRMAKYRLFLVLWSTTVGGFALSTSLNWQAGEFLIDTSFHLDVCIWQYKYLAISESTWFWMDWLMPWLDAAKDNPCSYISNFPLNF